jgi:hypothetical protein
VKFDSEEGVSSVQLIQTHVDTFIENMAFSTNSGKVLSADYVGEVFVYDINDGSKYQLALTAEDCFEDNNARPIGKAVFLDEERVAIGTNTGCSLSGNPQQAVLKNLIRLRNPSPTFMFCLVMRHSSSHAMVLPVSRSAQRKSPLL